ncbi:hypothetical protein M404DRAFT_1000223 [Pisolithus tinctorius Marx 270]|uniref:Uncharacterized protein n=1 Tax=Pisolithus tinctorius Marx 270 TaxID=870435 RepID=A0A0C3PBX9_PISTI|nr:hypothetical protein M404DRAFT_1000223 [Pisolithus tinctorius Marx 270]
MAYIWCYPSLSKKSLPRAYRIVLFRDAKGRSGHYLHGLKCRGQRECQSGFGDAKQLQELEFELKELSDVWTNVVCWPVSER